MDVIPIEVIIHHVCPNLQPLDWFNLARLTKRYYKILRPELLRTYPHLQLLEDERLLQLKIQRRRKATQKSRERICERVLTKIIPRVCENIVKNPKNLQNIADFLKPSIHEKRLTLDLKWNYKIYGVALKKIHYLYHQDNDTKSKIKESFATSFRNLCLPIDRISIQSRPARTNSFGLVLFR